MKRMLLLIGVMLATGAGAKLGKAEEDHWIKAEPDDGYVYWLDKTNNRIIRNDARRPPISFDFFRSGHLDGASVMELPEGLAQAPGATFAVQNGTIYFWDATGPRWKSK